MFICGIHVSASCTLCKVLSHGGQSVFILVNICFFTLITKNKYTFVLMHLIIQCFIYLIMYIMHMYSLCYAVVL